MPGDLTALAQLRTQRLGCGRIDRVARDAPTLAALLGEHDPVHLARGVRRDPSLEHVVQDRLGLARQRVAVAAAAGLDAADPLPRLEQRVADRLDLLLGAVG